MYSFNNSALVVSNGLEDRRAFELALEMSLLGLGSESNESSPSSLENCMFPSSAGSAHHQTHSMPNNLDLGLDGSQRLQSGSKRSQNTTECVPVPSSEHVAEIVGRQGCKIKALRAKTNTYIKTPVRNEEPVFVVTGRREDVQAAKREIMSAADHFSQIRAQRKNNGGCIGPAPNAHIPGNVTISVRVPYRVVGLVVGPKGATIKRIQQQTNTYIITPSREKEPIFEVTGLPEDVETARKEIEAHIAIRTGGIINGNATGESATPEELSNSHFSNSSLLSALENRFSSSDNFSLYNQPSTDFFSAFANEDGFASKNSFANAKADDLYSMFSPKATTAPMLQQQNKNSSINRSYDTDEGIGDSPTFDYLCNGTASIGSAWPDFSGPSFGSIGASEGCEFSRRNSSGMTSTNSISSTSSTPPSSMS